MMRVKNFFVSLFVLIFFFLINVMFGIFRVFKIFRFSFLNRFFSIILDWRLIEMFWLYGMIILDLCIFNVLYGFRFGILSG